MEETTLETIGNEKDNPKEFFFLKKRELEKNKLEELSA